MRRDSEEMAVWTGHPGKPEQDSQNWKPGEDSMYVQDSRTGLLGQDS
jgi:hypothetical protein